MEIDSAPAASKDTTSTQPRKFSPPIDPNTHDLFPEGTIYIRLLLILANLDAERVKEVRSLAVSGLADTYQAGDFAMETTEIISTLNRRTLDQLSAKVYFYLARAYELQGRLVELQSYVYVGPSTALIS